MEKKTKTIKYGSGEDVQFAGEFAAALTLMSLLTVFLFNVGTGMLV